MPMSLAVSCAAAEGERVRGQAVADRQRPDRDGIERDVAAAAEAEREQVRHPEQRAHAADLHDRVRLAREAVA